MFVYVHCGQESSFADDELETNDVRGQRSTMMSTTSSYGRVPEHHKLEK